jgi:hypothetical protein
VAENYEIHSIEYGPSFKEYFTSVGKTLTLNASVSATTSFTLGVEKSILFGSRNNPAGKNGRKSSDDSKSREEIDFL